MSIRRATADGALGKRIVASLISDHTRLLTGDGESICAPELALPSCKLLVADSDEGQLKAFRQHFNHGTWKVATAANGLECIAKLREFEPHVLVLEPEILWGRGSGVLAYMREDARASQIPVIALTSGRDRNELARVLQFTLNDFFIKPVPIETIARRIRNLVGVGKEC